MRLCSEPGCGRKIPDMMKFCDECRPGKGGEGGRNHRPAGQATSSYRDGVKLTGAERALEDLFQKEYMSRGWREVTRPRALRLTPICADCKAKLSEIVDHKIPARIVHLECIRRKLFPLQRVKGFHLLDNLVGLCHGCHNKKTAQEAGQDYSTALEAFLSRFKPGVHL